MILLIAVFISDIQPSHLIELRPGEPVPYADVLDQLLVNNKIIDRSNDGSLLDFIFGNENATSDFNSDNLDTGVLDYKTVHKIVERARKKYEASRRQTEPYRADWSVRNEAYRANPFFVDKAFDMMKQSIFSTRFRIAATKPIRKRFHNDISYNIAIMYGSLSQLILKMDNLYAQMQHFIWRTHFIWYLIIYEKMLAAHVDITSMVKRIFAYQKEWMEDSGTEAYDIDTIRVTRA